MPKDSIDGLTQALQARDDSRAAVFRGAYVTPQTVTERTEAIRREAEDALARAEREGMRLLKIADDARSLQARVMEARAMHAEKLASLDGITAFIRDGAYRLGYEGWKVHGDGWTLPWVKEIGDMATLRDIKSDIVRGAKARLDELEHEAAAFVENNKVDLISMGLLNDGGKQ